MALRGVAERKDVKRARRECSGGAREKEGAAMLKRASGFQGSPLHERRREGQSGNGASSDAQTPAVAEEKLAPAEDAPLRISRGET